MSLACAFACSGGGNGPSQDGTAPTGGAATSTGQWGSGGVTQWQSSGGADQAPSNGGAAPGQNGGTTALGGSGEASNATACGTQCVAGCSGTMCLLCAPDSSRCVGNAVAKCSSNGTKESAPVPCNGGSCVVSGGRAVCKSFACTPGQTFCDATADRVMQCSSDGFSSAITEDCAANGKACEGAACVPTVCTAGQRYCEGNSVRLCNANGTAASVATVCGASQHCDVSRATCATNICTPGALACNGSMATLCNGDGSGYASGGTDCTATAKVCSAGACVDPMCIPGNKTCNNGVVVQCNSDALTTSVVAACTSTQYCDPVTISCQAKVCDANQPVCAGSVLTKCDALGAGVLPGGSDCAPDYCSAGACTSALFFEDFEDGDYAGWWEPVPADYTRIVVTNGAEGTAHSLCMTHTGSTTVTSSGVMRTLPSLKPTYISWWARPQTKYSNFIELYPTSANSGWMIWQLYDERGNIALVRTSPPSDILVPHAMSWYHTEIKNIDWQQHTFDYYIDGALIAAGVALQSGGNQFGLIDYFHAGSSTGGCIDQILMK